MSPVSSLVLGQLAQTIADETEGLVAFIALLTDEQKSLQNGEIEALGKQSEQKSQLLLRLGRLAEQRNRLLADAGWPADKAGMDALAHTSDAAAQRSQHLLYLAAEARELNRLNGQLIAMHLQRTQNALAILTRSQAGSGLYGPNGQTAARTGYRFIDSA